MPLAVHVPILKSDTLFCNVHPNAIRGMFTSIALDFQIPLLYSRNYRDTAKIIKNICFKTKELATK